MGLIRWLYSSSDPHYYVADELLSQSLVGRTVIVTGATGCFGSGISELLVKQGATVVLAVRRLDAGEALAAKLNSEGSSGKALAMRVDLNDLKSIEAFATSFAAKHDSLHLLVENAAVCCIGNTPVAETGFEPHLAANHYGHIYLRHHLEPLLAASAPSRIVCVASALHDRLFTEEPTTLDLDASPTHLGFTTDPAIGQLQQWMAYARTKLCNVLSALAASERLAAKGVMICSVHPGIDTSTGLFRNMPKGAFIMWLFGRFIGVQTTHQCLQSILYCCLEEHDKLQPGAFYSQWWKAKYRDGQIGGWPMKSPNPFVTPEHAARLEAISYAALGLAVPGAPKQASPGGAQEDGAQQNVVSATPPTAAVLAAEVA